MSLCEANAVRVGDKGVMQVHWLVESEQCLKQTVGMGGGEQILAAGHMGDFLVGVIDHDCEVVGGSDVLAGEHHVAQKTGIDGAGTEAQVGEGKRPGDSGSSVGIEAPGGLPPGREVFRLDGGTEVTASARVKRSFWAVRSAVHARDFIGDFAAGAEAGINGSGCS